MTYSNRWYCPDCLRQWVYARNWEPGATCPTCGGVQVQRVSYPAAFPGGDYFPERPLVVVEGPDADVLTSDRALEGMPSPMTLRAPTPAWDETLDPYEVMGVPV